MEKTVSIRKRKYFVMLGGLNLHIWRMIHDYSPATESETRRLLEVLNRQYEAGLQKHGFIERLGAFWNRKINFCLNEVWTQIRCKNINTEERKLILEKVNEIEKLVEVAVEEMLSTEFIINPLNFINKSDFQLYIKTIMSFLEDPFEEGEARVIVSKLKDDAWEYEVTKIGIEQQIEPLQVVIKPLRELDDDDDMGHMMRHDGVIEIYSAGRIIADGWNLPIMETEEGEFFAPLEEMLVEFGGCPLGLVYNSKLLRGGDGYNKVEKSCTHCWKKDYCPGNDFLRAWTLGFLAKKLRFAWEHRNDVLKVIPGFEKKLLGMKT